MSVVLIVNYFEEVPVVIVPAAFAAVAASMVFALVEVSRKDATQQPGKLNSQAASSVPVFLMREAGNALLPAKVTRSYECEEGCVNDHRNYSGKRWSSIEDRIE